MQSILSKCRQLRCLSFYYNITHTVFLLAVIRSSSFSVSEFSFYLMLSSGKRPKVSFQSYSRTIKQTTIKHGGLKIPHQNIPSKKSPINITLYCLCAILFCDITESCINRVNTQETVYQGV